MTNEAPRSDGTEPAAHFRIRRGRDGKDQVSQYGGPWETIISEPLSDDPAVNAVGELSLSELQAIAEDETHPNHAAVIEYNRLWMDQLRPTIDALVNTTESGQRAAAAIAKASEPRSRLIDTLLRASEPGKRLSDVLFEKPGRQFLDALVWSTEPGKRLLDTFHKASEPGERTADYLEPIAQRYKELLADAMPDLSTSALNELSRHERLVAESAFDGEPEPGEQPERVEVPNISDAVVDLLREQSDILQVQNETLARMLIAAEQDAAAAAANEAQLRSDATHMKAGMWIGVLVGVAGAVAAFLAL